MYTLNHVYGLSLWYEGKAAPSGGSTTLRIVYFKSKNYEHFRALVGIHHADYLKLSALEPYLQRGCYARQISNRDLVWSAT